MGGGKAHVVIVPWPVQSHINPFMEFSHCLLHHGCRVTFLTTEPTLNRLINNPSKDHDDDGGDDDELLRLVSIPGEEYHPDKHKSDVLWPFAPHKVEDFIQETITSDEDGISCLVVDQCIGWGPEIAGNLGVPLAVFFPGSALWLALGLSIPNLIRDGVINSDGTPIEDGQMIQLSPTAPAINTNDFPWVRTEKEAGKRLVFEIGVRSREAAEKAEWMFCNSSSDFEPAAFSFIPNLTPVGPLVARNLRHGNNSAGNFWPEDETCLEWLNQHPPCSVIYAAFGGHTVFNQSSQFQELALGLQLSNRPFLWVVRPDSRSTGDAAFPEGFEETVVAGGGRGRIVGWAPQRKVLGHPSVACFMSHCGWNSTVEGLSNGVPFLCWPYFADQFMNQTYICDVWKVGLGFDRDDENGIITGEEIKDKVGKVIGDAEFRSRAVNLKQKAMDSVTEGGHSYNNFKDFVHWLNK